MKIYNTKKEMQTLNVSKEDFAKAYYNVDSLEKHVVLDKFLYISQKIIGGINCYKEHGFRYTIKRILQKIKNKIDKASPFLYYKSSSF